MQIGKYTVTAGASGSAAEGYSGYANRSWKSGSEDLDQTSYFEKKFGTADEAIKHAYEQAHLRVENKDWDD